MSAASARGRHPRPPKRYRGSARRIRRIAREEKTPLSLWVLLVVVLWLFWSIFSQFDRDAWVGRDEQIMVK